MRIIVGISGASGSIYGLRLLEKLRQNSNAEVHLIFTHHGRKTTEIETGKSVTKFMELAEYFYSPDDMSCRLASGSYPIDSMVVAPCSIHSMSAIAQGITSNVLLRAADVCLKERRKLILLVRESPLHLGHLRTMVSLAEMGTLIVPPIPGYYNKPQTVLEIVDHTVDRVLDLLGIPDPNAARWEGE